MKKLASLALLSIWLAIPSQAGIIRFTAKKIVKPAAVKSAKAVKFVATKVVF